jgi:hypothetical protein
MQRMSKTGCVTVVFFLGVVSGALANAEDASAPPTKFSIGAFIGYRGGGQGTDTNTGAHYQLAPAQTYGLVADFNVSPDTEVEVLWSQQNTRVQHGTVLDNNSSAVCTNGSCLVHVSGNLMWQYEANAGVYLSF